jgi:hypothetical protein
MYLITFYVPESDLKKVKDHLFKKGAGRYEYYEKCSWETLGEGQFLPLAGSTPSVGKDGKIEMVKEYRVEMICKDEILKEVLEELVKVHPYEEPAYYANKIETLRTLF